MSSRSISGFGGVAGRVFRESFSWGTFGTGVALALLTAGIVWMLHGERASSALAPALQIVWAIALVRIALNGAAGEWRGSVISTAGGPWSIVGGATLRYAALNVAWSVPVALVFANVSRSGGAEGMSFGMPDPRLLALGGLYAAATFLTPPVFLIAATTAERFGDLVSPRHWAGIYSGRTGDLALIYAIYLGSVLGLALLMLPLGLALFAVNRGLALFTGALAAVFIAGFAVTLLARLSGFFAAADAEPETDRTPATAPASPATAATQPSPPASGIPAAPEPPASTDRLRTTHLTLISGAPQTPSGKPPLLNARERVEEHVRRFDQSPEAVLAGLAELHREYAENPLVMHALCLLRKKAGDEAGAFLIAREGMPLFLHRGNVRLAAEAFHVLLDRAAELDLPREALLQIAGQLETLRLFGSAARAYAIQLDRDPLDTKAIKGLLHLGEIHLHQTGLAKEARSIYRYLLDRSPASPLADYMRQGLEEAERRLAGS